MIVIDKVRIVLIRVFQIFCHVKFKDIVFYVFPYRSVYHFFIYNFTKKMFPVFGNDGYKIMSILRIIKIIKAVLFMFFIHAGVGLLPNYFLINSFGEFKNIKIIELPAHAFGRILD